MIVTPPPASVRRAAERLLDWSQGDRWEPLLAEVMEAHLEPLRDDVEPQELLDEFPEDGVALAGTFMLECFYATRFGDGDDGNVVDDFLKRRGWRESVPARRYLEALRDSRLSFYEVIDVAPGRHVTLRDLLRGGGTTRVAEKLGSHDVAPWDCVAARVVTVNGRPGFSGAALPFPPLAAQLLLTGLEEMANDLERHLRDEPENLGSSGEEIRAAALDAMLPSLIFSQAVFQFWLTIMYGQLQVLLAGSSSASDDASALRDPPSTPLASETAPDPRLEPDGQIPGGHGDSLEDDIHAVHAALDEHYRGALDKPLAVLDGKSPRQAALAPGGHEQVVGWLKQVENTEYRRAAVQEGRVYATAWLWEELGLPEPH